MIVTQDATLAHDLRALRNQGRYPSDAWHQHSILGFNYRLSEINCALGCAQMIRIETILTRRAQVADWYRDHLGSVSDIQLPPEAPAGDRISWFVYVIRLGDGADTAPRDRVMNVLTRRGIECGRYFAPVHQQPAYASFPVSHALPVTEAESRRTLALPFFTALSDAEVASIAAQIRQALP